MASARVVCVDASGLLALEQSPEHGSRWLLLSQAAPPPHQPASSTPRGDPARHELEQAAQEDFTESGGESAGRGAAMRAWRGAFIQRRLTCVVRGARSALSGTTAADAQDERLATRKKDAPEHGDRERVRSFVAAQAEQASMARDRCAPGPRKRKLVAAAGQSLPGGALVWDAPASSAYEYRLHDSAATPESPRRRAVVDGLASASECQHAIGASLLGMDGLSDPDSPTFNGELTLVASPPERLQPFLGEGGVRIVRLLLWRIVGALRSALGEQRELHLSGALLTRLLPPPRAGPATAAHSANTYAYSVAHVDRANVASYDYSAVLYLNTKGSGFEGGDFQFVDERGEEVVEPQAGRCVLFPSGFENLHRVCPVTAGNRYALAAWFTLTASAADGPVVPAPYTLHDPVPPPSRADVEAASVRLEDLKARLMAAGGCSG